ncbi:MAG: MFS transporter [Acidobacteriota bacterium]|jgi:predicted MFS family arabinose efflux permease|nr:MFS transporter [Acidobacteriota bacterium]
MKDEELKKRFKAAIFIFILVSAFTGFHTGAVDSVISNYFKEAYGTTAQQRGLIEFPRELPGIFSLFVIAAFSFLRDIRTAIIAQALGAIGMAALGFFHPGFGIMLVFLFVFSLGQHMFMPLGDSIGLSLASKNNMGRILGLFNSARMAFGMIAGLVCFFGFRSGFFNFNTPVLVYAICAIAFIACAILLMAMHARIGVEIESRTEASRMVFRKEYIRYYVICALFGGRKQIMYVFSPWVLIELLGFKTDTMSIIGVIGSFIGIFFIPLIGKMIDRLGCRFTMIIEAGCFVVIYIAYGLLSKWVNEPAVVVAGMGMFFVYVLIIFDRMSGQFYMVRSIYLKSIAIKPEDVTPSLSTGMAIDHGLAIIGAFLCGIVWDVWGPEYVFVIAAVLSAANMIVAYGVKKDAVIDRPTNPA